MLQQPSLPGAYVHIHFDFSATGHPRVVVLSILGTLFCICGALILDSYSFATGVWTWHERWVNNIIIPAILAPPFFLFLLAKLRELALANEKLNVMATTDSLTSCLTRRAFASLVEGYMERPPRGTTRHGALLIIDVDNFKLVNDRFGHHNGDEALRAIATAIRGNVRETDLVCRMGGEEFGVFLPGLSPGLTLASAERIRMAVKSLEFRPEGVAFPLGVSIGGATFERKTPFHDLFRQADERLYYAKRNGRDRVAVKRFAQEIARARAVRR